MIEARLAPIYGSFASIEVFKLRGAPISGNDLLACSSDCMIVSIVGRWYFVASFLVSV